MPPQTPPTTVVRSSRIEIAIYFMFYIKFGQIARPLLGRRLNRPRKFCFIWTLKIYELLSGDCCSSTLKFLSISCCREPIFAKGRCA